MGDILITQHVLERAGCPIHYWLTGPEERLLVVFTHGATIDHREFDPQVPVVAEEYRVLTWDVRGHGQSRPAREAFSIRRAVEDLVDILDHLGYAQAIFIGHSMGGNITQEMVFLHPERVKALIMLGCTCNTLKLSALEALAVRMTPLILRLYPYEVLKRQSARVSAVKPEVQAYLYEVFNQVSKEEFITILVETSRCLHYEPEYRITHPMLLTHGDHDITGNIERIAPTWAARDPNCRYVVIPEAGHAANLDNPEFFNRLLLDFLHEHAPTTAKS